MASTTFTRGTDLVAFFRRRSDALKAITELKDAGFTSDQIGLALSHEEAASKIPAAGSELAAGPSWFSKRRTFHVGEDQKLFQSGT